MSFPGIGEFVRSHIEQMKSERDFLLAQQSLSEIVELGFVKSVPSIRV